MLRIYNTSLHTGDGTGAVTQINLNDTPAKSGHTGLWSADVFFVSGSSTAILTLQGRMLETDTWMTLNTVTEADLGTSSGVHRFMQEVSFLPYVRVVVSNSNNAGNLNVNNYQV